MKLLLKLGLWKEIAFKDRQTQVKFFVLLLTIYIKTNHLVYLSFSVFISPVKWDY